MLARRVIVAAVMLSGGCTGGAPGAAEPVRAVAIEEAPGRAVAPVDDGDLAGLMKTLAAAAVYHEAPVRSVLYTWTTTEQVDELAARPVLLTRETTEGGERSRFDAALAGESGEVARSLLQPGRRARRFAWPVPWATVMGWDGGGWGGVLVRVELRPEAITAVFRPGEPWRFLDSEGKPVPESTVSAAPERLAVVYHVALASAERPGFREYVLVNEQMIARWTLGGMDVRGEIAAQAELLERAADKFDALRALAATRCEAQGAASCPEAELPEGPGEIAAWSGRLIDGPWARPPAARDVLLADLYAACLAVPGAAYVPTGVKIRAIAGRMQSAENQPRPLDPLEVTPDPASAAEATARQPKKTKSRDDRRLEERCRWDLSLADCYRRDGEMRRAGGARRVGVSRPRWMHAIVPGRSRVIRGRGERSGDGRAQEIPEVAESASSLARALASAPSPRRVRARVVDTSRGSATRVLARARSLPVLKDMRGARAELRERRSAATRS